MTHGSRPALLSLLGLVACAGPPAAPSPETPAVLPVVRVEPGRPDTLALGGAGGIAPGVTVVALGDGRSVVAADRAGLLLVPVGAGRVLVVDAAPPPPTDGGAGRLVLRLVGPSPRAPDLLRFDVRRVTASGADTTVALDDEEGAVPLVGDRPYGDNAIDAFADYVVLDLDEVGAGRHTVRLAARVDGLVSNWVGAEVVDGRFVREVPVQVVGGG